MQYFRMCQLVADAELPVNVWQLDQCFSAPVQLKLGSVAYNNFEPLQQRRQRTQDRAIL